MGTWGLRGSFEVGVPPRLQSPADSWRPPCLVTTEILFFWLFKIKNQWKQWKQCVQTHNKVCGICFWKCPETYTLRPTWQCPCITGVPEAIHEAKFWALKEHSVSWKSPSRVGDWDEGVAEKRRNEGSFLTRGHCFVNIFIQQVKLRLQRPAER